MSNITHPAETTSCTTCGGEGRYGWVGGERDEHGTEDCHDCDGRGWHPREYAILVYWSQSREIRRRPLHPDTTEREAIDVYAATCDSHRDDDRIDGIELWRDGARVRVVVEHGHVSTTYRGPLTPQPHDHSPLDWYHYAPEPTP